MRRLRVDEINAMDLETVTQTLEEFLRLQNAYELLVEKCFAEPASQTPKSLRELEREKKIKDDYAQSCQFVSALASQKYALDIAPIKEKLRSLKSTQPGYEYLLFEKYEETAQNNLSGNLEFIKFTSDQQFDMRVIEISKLISMHADQLKKNTEMKQLTNKLSSIDRNNFFDSACRIIAEHQSNPENSLNPVPLVLCSAMGEHTSAKLQTETLMQFIACDFSKKLQNSAFAAQSSATEDNQHIWQPQQIIFALEVVHETYTLISREKDNAPAKLDKLRKLIMSLYGITSTQNKRYYNQHDVMIAKPIDTDVHLYDSTMKEILDALESCSKFPRGRIKEYVQKLLVKVKNKKKWDFELPQKETGSSAADDYIDSSSLADVKTNRHDDDPLPVLPLREDRELDRRLEHSFYLQLYDAHSPTFSPPPPLGIPASLFGNSRPADCRSRIHKVSALDEMQVTTEVQLK